MAAPVSGIVGSRGAALALRALQWLARHHVGLLLLLWLLAEVISWRVNHSPHPYGDSGHYLRYAQQIADQGNFEREHHNRYVGYALFLSVFLKLGLGLTAMALGQYALSGLAAVALYRAVRRLAHGSWEPAFLATLLYIGWFEIQSFNAFLLTESLFTSLLLFSFWAVSRARTTAGWALALLVLLITVSIRPNGFVALAAAALVVAMLIRQRASRRVQGLVAVGGVLLLPVAWFALNQLLLTFKLIATYQEGMIIFMYKDILMYPAEPLVLPTAEAAPVWRLAYFILHNPRYFGQLAVWKMIFFMGFPKPYFSSLHILWNLTVLPVLYWLAIRALALRQIARTMRVFLAAVVLLQAGIVALTVEDYEARFSGPVLPYVFALAALGFMPIWRKIQCWLDVKAGPATSVVSSNL